MANVENPYNTTLQNSLVVTSGINEANTIKILFTALDESRLGALYLKNDEGIYVNQFTRTVNIGEETPMPSYLPNYPFGFSRWNIVNGDAYINGTSVTATEDSIIGYTHQQMSSMSAYKIFIAFDENKALVQYYNQIIDSFDQATTGTRVLRISSNHSSSGGEYIPQGQLQLKIYPKDNAILTSIVDTEMPLGDETAVTTEIPYEWKTDDTSTEYISVDYTLTISQKKRNRIIYLNFE